MGVPGPTEDLPDRLPADIEEQPPSTATRRLPIGLALTAVATVLVVVLLLALL